MTQTGGSVPLVVLLQIPQTGVFRLHQMKIANRIYKQENNSTSLWAFAPNLEAFPLQQIINITKYQYIQNTKPRDSNLYYNIAYSNIYPQISPLRLRSIGLWTIGQNWRSQFRAIGRRPMSEVTKERSQHQRGVKIISSTTPISIKRKFFFKTHPSIPQWHKQNNSNVIQ